MSPNEYVVIITLLINPDDPRFWELIAEIEEYMEANGVQGEIASLEEVEDETYEMDEPAAFISELELEILKGRYAGNQPLSKRRE